MELLYINCGRSMDSLDTECKDLVEKNKYKMKHTSALTFDKKDLPNTIWFDSRLYKLGDSYNKRGLLGENESTNLGEFFEMVLKHQPQILMSKDLIKRYQSIASSLYSLTDGILLLREPFSNKGRRFAPANLTDDSALIDFFRSFEIDKSVKGLVCIPRTDLKPATIKSIGKSGVVSRFLTQQNNTQAIKALPSGEIELVSLYSNSGKFVPCEKINGVIDIEETLNVADLLFGILALNGINFKAIDHIEDLNKTVDNNSTLSKSSIFGN